LTRLILRFIWSATVSFFVIEIVGGLGVARFARAPLVQAVPGDIVKGELSLLLVQLEGHEPLPVVEEPELVLVWLEDSSPCFRTAAAREVLDRTATAGARFARVKV